VLVPLGGLGEMAASLTGKVCPFLAQMLEGRCPNNPTLGLRRASQETKQLWTYLPSAQPYGMLWNGREGGGLQLLAHAPRLRSGYAS
jgi:hypothetical protein